jgi:hypothetical protein
MTQKVASVCRRHNAPLGSPSDLEGLLRELQRNKHLAMDFWSMVSQMSVPVDSGQQSIPAVPGPAPSARMLQQLALEAIVRTIAGLSVFEMMAAGGEPRQAVAHLANLLAGSDLEYDAADLDHHTEIDAANDAPARTLEMLWDASTSQPVPWEEALGARLEQESSADRRHETALIAADSAALSAIDQENEPAKGQSDLPRALASEVFISNAALAPTGDTQLRHLFGHAAIAQPKRSAAWPLLFRPHTWLRRRTPTVPQ